MSSSIPLGHICALAGAVGGGRGAGAAAAAAVPLIFCVDFDPYERRKLEIIFARAAKNRVQQLGLCSFGKIF